MEIKVMTYNIHHAEGMDNKVSLKRIAEIIKSADPDVVGINEADKYNFRSFFINQPQELAKRLNMHCFFGQNVKLWLTKYGNAVLSKMNIRQVDNILLPYTGEQRSFIKANIDLGGTTIKFISTHIGLRREERSNQIATIAKTVQKAEMPVILAGDFNCSLQELSPLQSFMQASGEDLTFPANAPREKIDHIFCSYHFDIIETYTLKTMASDHLPLVARLRLNK